MAFYNYCKVETWTVDRLVNSVGKFNDKNEKIDIPKYQRSIAWIDTQKKLFINSIKSGFPIGSLLLFKREETTNKTVFHLVDGLQRVLSLKKYIENPLEYITDEDIKAAFPMEKGIIDPSTDILLFIKNWLEKNKISDKVKYTGRKLHLSVKDKINETLDEELIDDEFSKFLDNLEKSLVINSIEIPVVIYNGPHENLPIIFERLNKEGTKLNKYQILAATWINTKIKINNMEIITHIQKRYDQLIENGFTIENYNQNSNDFATSDFSAFEYVFGFGKLLSEKFPYLFDQTDEDNADSIAFNLITICLGSNLKDMDKIHETIKIIDQNKFEKALLDSIGIVYLKLKPIITLNANKKKTQGTNIKKEIYHSDSQIVSIIGKVFKSKYDINFDENKKWKEVNTKLLSNIVRYYIFDIIRGYWGSAVDQKINENILENSRYDQVISDELWNNALSEWHQSQLSKKEQTRTNISYITMLFLKAIYMHILTAYEDISDQEFHIDHIIPIDKLKDLATDQGGAPISAVANLCLLTKELNQSKTNLTYYEYLSSELQNGSISKEQKSALQSEYERFSFVKEDKLAFATGEILIEKYREFLDYRFDVLRSKFLEWVNN